MKSRCTPTKTKELDWSGLDAVFEKAGVRMKGEYLPEGRTTAEMAEHYGVSDETIRVKMSTLDKDEFQQGWKHQVARNGVQHPVTCWLAKKNGK